MILELGREHKQATLQDLPTELFQLYTALIDADVEDDVARELIVRAKQHASPSQLRTPQTMWTLLTGLVECELKTGQPIAPARGRRHVVALVGPTGVGKTTTLAKLAANFRLRDGIKLGLVTVDTYRIAAVEQLKTYAEIIELPMKVVTTPDEMRRALDEFAGLDLVLVDTAGRSPQDDLKIHELQQFIQAAQADEVHLVLSLTASFKALSSAVQSFQSVGVTSLIFTKLDEAPGLGTLFNLARRVPTPISYVTTGQDVPDDIEPAVAPRLAKLILGQDKLN
jgi:flagellar biosynthesis protein FlhF